MDAVRTSGVDRDAILTASHLSENLQSFEFYFTVLFMKNVLYKMKISVREVQEIDQDILSSLDALCHTQDAILRMRNDEVGLHGILTLAVEKCKSFGINPFMQHSGQIVIGCKTSELKSRIKGGLSISYKFPRNYIWLGRLIFENVIQVNSDKIEEINKC